MKYNCSIDSGVTEAPALPAYPITRPELGCLAGQVFIFILVVKSRELQGCWPAFREGELSAILNVRFMLNILPR